MGYIDDHGSLRCNFLNNLTYNGVIQRWGQVKKGAKQHSKPRYVAPPVRFELTTQRLTAACSATELQGSDHSLWYRFFFNKSSSGLQNQGRASLSWEDSDARRWNPLPVRRLNIFTLRHSASPPFFQCFSKPN